MISNHFIPCCHPNRLVKVVNQSFLLLICVFFLQVIFLLLVTLIEEKRSFSLVDLSRQLAPE